MQNVLTRRAAAALLALALAAPALAQSVTGTYRVEGRNPDGSAYSGAAKISESNGAISMSWQVGGQSYSGSGTRNGDVVWVDWGDSYPVVYVRMPNGELHGTWANGTALEKLVP